MWKYVYIYNNGQIPRSRSQEPRTKSQGPGPKDLVQEGTKDSACLGRARGQEPRTKEQESQGPRTKDHAGAKDHVGVKMIKKE